MCGNNACLRFAFVGTKSLCVCTLSFLGNGRGYSCSLYALVIYAPCIQHPPVFSPSFHGNCTPCISNAERRPLANSLSPCFIFTSTRSPPLSVSLPVSIYLCILCFCSLMKPHGTPPSFQYMERIQSGPLLPSLHSSSLIRDIVCIYCAFITYLKHGFKQLVKTFLFIINACFRIISQGYWSQLFPPGSIWPKIV